MQLMLRPAAYNAWIAFFAVILAGIALTPIGAIPVLPPTVATSGLFGAALTAAITGLLFARPRFPTLSRGLLFAGLLSTIAGGALLAVDQQAQLRATAIATLLLSMIGGLLSLHLWEQVVARAQLFTPAHTLNRVFRLWHGIFAAMIALIILLPLLVPGFNSATTIFAIVRLFPIAVGVAIAVALLGVSWRYRHIGKSLEAIAWSEFLGQGALLLGQVPYSLAWSLALGLIIAHVVIVARWIALAQNQQALIAGRTILSLREEMAILRASLQPLSASEGASVTGVGLDSDWLSLMYHDIKRAMSNVMLGATYLRNAMGREKDLRRAEFAQKVVSSSKRLDRFFNLLMDYLRQRDPHPRPLTITFIPLVKTIANVVEDERHLRQNPIAMITDPPADQPGQAPDPDMVVGWDLIRIEELLMNLIDNAVKYSGLNQTIEVRIWLDETDRVVLAVSDHGRGMSEAIALKAFDPGFRADGTLPGQGLGLTIVKLIADWHGGTVEVHSVPDAGTQVRVILPREAPAT